MAVHQIWKTKIRKYSNVWINNNDSERLATDCHWCEYRFELTMADPPRSTDITNWRSWGHVDSSCTSWSSLEQKLSAPFFLVTSHTASFLTSVKALDIIKNNRMSDVWYRTRLWTVRSTIGSASNHRRLESLLSTCCSSVREDLNQLRLSEKTPRTDPGLLVKVYKPVKVCSRDA